jgi:hypothetical protein
MNIEWRRNKAHTSCYDLLVDGKYAHIWVQDAGLSWHALQFMHSEKLTSHPTKKEAQEFLIAQLVQRRLDGETN